jgi:4'-phosphopantetheinyl transferase
MNKTGWKHPDARTVLETNEVHVWKASLDASQSQLAVLTTLLSSDERARARTYRFQEHSKRFVVARGLLRMILARYLRTDPEEVQFAFSDTGKPELRPDLRPGIRFNLSHSHDVALLAIARAFDVGVDIERIRADCPVESIVEALFSLQERANFKSVPAHLKNKTFFTCWVRKEALAKALGCGLPVALDQFAVSAISGEPAKLLWTQNAATEIGQWSLIDLPVGSGYQGALAIRTQEPILRCWDASRI